MSNASESDSPNRLLGIDLLTPIKGDGVYGLCESFDNGTHWNIIRTDEQIEDLLNFAKNSFNHETPMIMPQHIHHLLKFQILEQRHEEKTKRLQQSYEIKQIIAKALSTDISMRHTWWKRIVSIFKRR